MHALWQTVLEWLHVLPAVNMPHACMLLMCMTHNTGTAHNKTAATVVLTRRRQALRTATASSSASNYTCRAFVCTALSAKPAELYLLQGMCLHLAVNYGRVSK